MLTDFLVLDLETTGFSPCDDGIVEISAIRVDTGGTGQHFSTLVNPGRPIPGAASAIHGLRDEDVVHSPKAAEALELLLEFLEAPKTLWVAHNAGFDSSFLGHGFLRAGRTLPENPMLDSLALARSAWPGVPSRSLEALAEGYGVPVHQKHRAMADCQTLAHLLPLLVRDLPQEGPGLQQLINPFPTVAFPQAHPPAGWELLDQAIQEGRELDLEWKTPSGPESGLLKTLRLVRRGWRINLLALRPRDGRTLEILLRDLLKVDGRRPPAPPPFVPSPRDKFLARIGAGASLQEAATRLAVDQGTALRFVCDALVQGEPLAWKHLVPTEQLEEVRGSMDQTPGAPLRLLRSSLPPEIDWSTMQLGLASWYGERALTAAR